LRCIKSIMQDEFDLSRFVDAQAPIINQVRSELRDGLKRTHWMWYIFPQLRGLGHSRTAQLYAIGFLAEARAYLRHPVLGPRLCQCTELVNRIDGRSAYPIFGSPDDIKFHSSVTLFSRADPAQQVLMAALEKYFDGVSDARTIEMLA
jgi:uncharacterized protein (DUF1810 family)